MTILSTFRLDPYIPVTIKKFSAGEVQVTLDLEDQEHKGHIEIHANLKCSDGIIALAQIKDILDDWVRGTNPLMPIVLVMPYVPYARQDRAMVDGDAFSLKVFTNIINALNFDEICILDPHSDVTPALLNKCTIYTQAQSLSTLVKDKYDAIVSPDGGALKKIYQCAKAIGVTSIIKADKERCVETGKILSTTYRGDVAGKKLLIVDDICDGGFTFINLAKLLKENGATQVDLFVSHGIFSKGLDVLKPYIDHVHTHVSWVPAQGDFLSAYFHI